jgi:hypothetical protein
MFRLLAFIVVNVPVSGAQHGINEKAIDQFQAEVNQAIDAQTQELVVCHLHASGKPSLKLLSNLKKEN